MHQTARWGYQRYLTLVIVMGLHMLVLWELLSVVGPGEFTLRASEPGVEVMMLVPASLPRIRSKPASPKRLNADRLQDIDPPSIGTLAVSATPSSAISGGGFGVDWAAEARCSRLVAANYELTETWNNVFHTSTTLV